MLLLIADDPNYLKLVAKVDEVLLNYKVMPTPPEERTLDQFLWQLEKKVENFNAVDENGNNALHYAVQHGKLKRDMIAHSF